MIRILAIMSLFIPTCVVCTYAFNASEKLQVPTANAEEITHDFSRQGHRSPFIIRNLQRALKPGLRHRILSHARHLQQQETSKCPDGCTKHGTCNEELGRCDCPRHLSGPDCSVESNNISITCRSYGYRVDECFESSPMLCLNKCNGQGKCESGFCKCDPGFYGADCCLSLDTSGKPALLLNQGYKPRTRAPKIYVYELPPSLNNIWFNPLRFDRPLFYLFWQRLLSSGVRVADGHIADFYFIPIKARMGAHDDHVAVDVVTYIRKQWPWWDKHGGGGRHIIIHTGDMGRSEAGKEVQKLLENVTWLTHWGLHQAHKSAGWPASHRPGKDIVVPIFLQPSLVQSYGMHTTPLHPAAQKTDKGRKNQTFFFAGRICGDRSKPIPGEWPNCDLSTNGQNGYSAGTRQKIHYHHWNRSGYQVVTSTKSYGRDMTKSTFCLAPTGGGHGKRNVLVTMMGCVPVTVTDGVYQPFEPELDWPSFSVPIAESDIPRMHELLEEVTDDRLREYQGKLSCAAQHIFWSSIYGSVLGDDGRFDAFETTMEILRMKLQYPGLPPQDYVEKDIAFRMFMDCQTVTEPNLIPAAPIQSYAAVSLSNVIATSCQYEALKYVSFAIQTLAKSAKAMPVMMWGSLYSGKRYKVADYAHASVITLGCTIFVTTGAVSSRVVLDRTDYSYLIAGGLLMLFYLAVDGLTSTWQDSLFRQFNMGICDQVLFTTMFSTLLSLVATIATGQLSRAVSFILRNPEAVWWILALSLSSAVVQMIISYTIKRFGAVVFATIMTTRQFFSVLLSSVVFLTPLTYGQWVGVGIVFGALYYKLLLGPQRAVHRASAMMNKMPVNSPPLSAVASAVGATEV
ncbi:hypothetical protein CEUSTIGMA_g10153.t1 [Chlamydomonas eustigma]|uniref:EGF-like domain-containing protein n=1 Tax=Chlamydomonas eustigma TaxID=1157962 RepID=A0A250XI13_9CHLO|nr:hypothetical protein CEUSTIGMA_g10153.t1 [Chlamydomonas eustigma]|eukprot:GAX82727.1 hypothetical protein CEUSTIGMA_g10153.t1 [Chlamydomonas eustigma]